MHSHKLDNINPSTFATMNPIFPAIFLLNACFLVSSLSAHEIKESIDCTKIQSASERFKCLGTMEQRSGQRYRSRNLAVERSYFAVSSEYL